MKAWQGYNETKFVPETVDARDDTTADEILIRRRREML